MTEFGEFISAIIEGNLDSVRILFRKGFIYEKYCGHTPLQCASTYDKNGDIVHYLLCKGCDLEAMDKNGRRAIHIAAWFGKTAVVTKLIAKGCCLDCADKEGHTPLELAKSQYNEECVRILQLAMTSEQKKNIDSAHRTRDSEGFFKWPPLRKKSNIAQGASGVKADLELLEDNLLSKIMDNMTGMTLLDKLLKYKDPIITDTIKSKPVTEEEIKDWISTKLRIRDPRSAELLHECLLYRCMRHNYQEGCATLCTPEIINRGSLFMGPTSLETAVEFGSVLCVERCIRKVVNVDDSWIRAANLAKEKELPNISSLISDRRSYLDRRQQNGYSRLHVAVYDNDSDMVRYILENKTIDPDMGNMTVGTALSLAYDLGHVDCVQSLQNNNVNVNTVNKLRQSPLHRAIFHRIEDHHEYLVDNSIITETEDYMGLTVKELSVVNGCRNICERLVKRIAGLDRYLNIDPRLLAIDPDLSMLSHRIPCIPITTRETIFSLCIKVNATIYPCLLDAVDERTIHMTDINKNTMLHLCAISLLSNMCALLIDKSAAINLCNESERSPLFELLLQNCERYTKVRTDREIEGSSECSALEKEILETVCVLVNAGASVDMTDSEGCSILQKATEYRCERLLVALIQRKQPLESVKEAHWLSWFKSKYFSFIPEVIPLIVKSTLSKWIKPNLIKCALLETDISFVWLLYEKASHDVQINVVESILYKAASIDDRKLFEEISNNEISSESSLIDGESLLNCLIRERKIGLCRILLRSKNKQVLLEKKNAANKLPLHVCIENDLWDIIDQLIWNTKSVNQEDLDGNTPLSLMLEKISETEEETMIDRFMGYIRTLITKSGDIFKVNRLDRVVIDYCTTPHLKQELETFFYSQQTTQQLCLEPQETDEAHEISLAPLVNADPLGAAAMICSICAEERISFSFNCGHCFCQSCAYKECICYICRRPIIERTKLFI